MTDAEIFNLDDFRNRENQLIYERHGLDERPELSGISPETIEERLVELGKGTILTVRLAAELGEDVDPNILRAATQIRNLTMRTLSFISPDHARRAEEWATAEWMEAAGGSLDPQRISEDLAEQVQAKVKGQMEEGER